MTDQEVNAEYTESMVMSRNEHAAQNNNITLGNTFGKAEQFRYLENLKKEPKNSIHEEMRADWIRRLLAVIRCRNVCPAGCCPKV